MKYIELFLCISKSCSKDGHYLSVKESTTIFKTNREQHIAHNFKGAICEHLNVY